MFEREIHVVGGAPAGVSRFAQPDSELCMERLTELLDGMKKSKGAIIKLYLENFKSFNDTFGFHFGGLFIQEIGRYLCDIKGAEVHRTAGVEFVVILDGMSRAEAEHIAFQMIERFDRSWKINNTDCIITINIAIAYYPGHAESAEEMLENLSHAISESAARGQNQLVIYDEDLKLKIYRRNSIAVDIPKALEEGRVEVRYRPSQNIERGCFTRAECYLRLMHPEFGVIQAAEFIPIAEESGQINAIGNYAINRVCKMIAELNAAGKDYETIAVPVSPIQFMQENFVDEVEAAINEAGIAPQNLAFEISDTSTITGYASSQMRVQEFADMGIEIILVDFGTGYTGINSVLNLPVSTVKLERLFIWQLDNDPRVGVLIEGLIHIAKNLGLKLIAQGVETETQVERLKEYGCAYEQGFFYSPTMTDEELLAALQTK